MRGNGPLIKPADYCEKHDSQFLALEAEIISGRLGHPWLWDPVLNAYVVDNNLITRYPRLYLISRRKQSARAQGADPTGGQAVFDPSALSFREYCAIRFPAHYATDEPERPHGRLVPRGTRFMHDTTLHPRSLLPGPWCPPADPPQGPMYYGPRDRKMEGVQRVDGAALMLLASRMRQCIPESEVATLPFWSLPNEWVPILSKMLDGPRRVQARRRKMPEIMPTECRPCRSCLDASLLPPPPVALLTLDKRREVPPKPEDYLPPPTAPTEAQFAI
jgi:hypothetical protein